MSAFPLRYAHQNVLFGEADARAALYRVSCISYPFMPAADKREWLGRLARFAYAVEADFSLWRVNRAYPAERYVAQAEPMLDRRHQRPEAWRSYLEGHEAHLRTLCSFEPELYLAIALKPEQPGAARRRAHARDGPRAPPTGGIARSQRWRADRRRRAGRPDRRRGARVSSRGGMSARAARDDARAAVAAAPRRLPRPR